MENPEIAASGHTHSSSLKTYVIVSALVAHGDQFLIAKRSLKKRWAPGQWEFPSGFLDKSLPPAEQIILEELDEEFLIRDAVVSKVGEPFTYVDAEARWIILPMLIAVPNSVAVLHPDEHSELRWVSIQDLHGYDDIKPFLAGMLKTL